LNVAAFGVKAISAGDPHVPPSTATWIRMFGASPTTNSSGSRFMNHWLFSADVAWAACWKFSNV